jgi:hypothetical protein
MYCVGIGEPETLGMADFVIPGFDGFTFEKLTAPRPERAKYTSPGQRPGD